MASLGNVFAKPVLAWTWGWGGSQWWAWGGEGLSVWFSQGFSSLC